MVSGGRVIAYSVQCIPPVLACSRTRVRALGFNIFPSFHSAPVSAVTWFP